jgi:glycosyltransferase involved in cell wall biosynthesis
VPPEQPGSDALRVLAISSYGVLGGAELSFASFLEHRPANIEAHALLLTDGPLRGKLEALGLEVRSESGLDGKPRPKGAFVFTRRLRRLLRHTRPDVVWAVGQKAALLSVPACRLGRVPLVWHKVDFSWDSLLAKPLALGATGVVATSNALTEPLGRLRRRLLGVVWPPMRLPESVEANPGASPPTIGTLGRLVPYKGHHLVLRAAALLAPRHPELRVVVAGGPVREYPDYPAELERLVRELGLAERVELPGFVADVGGLLPRLRVMVNATYRDEEGFGLEGLSGAVLEASWAGLPVVVTEGGGAAEEVQDGVTGTLVETAEPEALARAIEPYLADAELAGRVGAAGRSFVRGAGIGPAESSVRLFGLLAQVA